MLFINEWVVFPLTYNNINSLAILFSYSHVWLPDNWHCIEFSTSCRP